jgi:hypothetical protein
MVWISKVACYGKLIFDRLVAMELGPIIKRDRLEVFPMLFNGFDTCIINFFNGSSMDLFYNDETGTPLNEGNYTMMAVSTDYGVPFPMAYAGSVLNF